MTAAKTAGYLLPGSVVMLQSDCVNALAQIRRYTPAAVDNPITGGLSVGVASRLPIEAARPAYLAIDRLARETGIHLQVRHVKGHQEGAGRSWVNRTCDEIAKTAMRQVRSSIDHEARAGAEVHQ